MTTDVTEIEGAQAAERPRSPRFAVDKAALKKLRLVAVAYSHVKVRGSRPRRPTRPRSRWSSAQRMSLRP